MVLVGRTLTRTGWQPIAPSCHAASCARESGDRRPSRARAARARFRRMSDMVLAGGTVVTAEASFRADVAVEDERIAAVGVDLPTDGAEVVDVSGALLMPGFIDGHTHLDMPFGGTVTSDDWDTGTAAARRRRDDDDRRLLAAGHRRHAGRGGRDLAGQGRGQGAHRLRPARRHHQPHRRGQGRDPVAARARRLDDQDLHGLQGHAALHGRRGPLRGDADRPRGRACSCSCTPRTATSSPSSRREALERGDTDPHWHALTRPELVEAEATNRAIRLAEIADTPLLVVHVSCAAALEEVRRAHARGSTIYAETCPQYFVFEYADLERPDFEGAKYVCSPPMRDPSNRPALWRGLQAGDLQIFGSDHCSFNFARARRSSAATTSR